MITLKSSQLFLDFLQLLNYNVSGSLDVSLLLDLLPRLHMHIHSSQSTRVYRRILEVHLGIVPLC
jgi:hypothetical protein